MVGGFRYMEFKGPSDIVAEKLGYIFVALVSLRRKGSQL